MLPFPAEFCARVPKVNPQPPIHLLHHRIIESIRPSQAMRPPCTADERVATWVWSLPEFEGAAVAAEEGWEVWKPCCAVMAAAAARGEQ
jgi:hypothetical protein